MNAILQSELTTDPLTRGYSTMSDEQVVASLKLVNRTVRQPVPLRSFIRWLVKSERLDKITTASTEGTTPGVRTAAKYILLLIQSGETVDPDDTDDVAAINLLVSSGTITSADRAELSALANRVISRETELGLPPVGPHHVAAARG